MASWLVNTKDFNSPISPAEDNFGKEITNSSIDVRNLSVCKKFIPKKN